MELLYLYTKGIVPLNFNQNILVKSFFEKKDLVKVIRFVFGKFSVSFLLIAFLQNNALIGYNIRSEFF